MVDFESHLRFQAQLECHKAYFVAISEICEAYLT